MGFGEAPVGRTNFRIAGLARACGAATAEQRGRLNSGSRRAG